jgi:hypothetical protein
MANQLPMRRSEPVRRSDSTGHTFGLLMLAIVLVIVLLMWYFQGHQDSNPLPQRPPGIQHQV